MNVTWGRSRFRGPVARGYEEADLGTGHVYGALLAQRGREPRPPLDWDRIGVILQGLIEGLGLRHKIDESVVQPGDDSSPGLYATAVAALLAVLTRPVGDPGDIDDALHAMLDSADGAEPSQQAAHAHHQPTTPGS